MPRSTRDFAVRKGFIRPLDVGRQGKAHLIAWDEAVLVVIAAVLAYAAGVAITTVLRALRETGASVSGGNIVIPVGG